MSLMICERGETGTWYDGELTAGDIRDIRYTILKHTPVTIMQLSPRAENALIRNNKMYLWDVIDLSREEVLRLKWTGPKVRQDIATRFRQDFGIHLPNWVE